MTSDVAATPDTTITPDAGIRIDRIVTRGGDRGQTSLADGTRVLKTDPRIEAMGAVDETNAALGLLRAAIEDSSLLAIVAAMQNDLFDLGAGLCHPGVVARLPQAAIERLEREVAILNEAVGPLTSFVLPGGTAAAAAAHLARTLARRAERRAWALGDEVDPLACRYLNRLSDILFVLARVLNDNGRADVLWQPSRK
jgi:cob(I)alamin adenosyltransferase